MIALVECPGLKKEDVDITWNKSVILLVHVLIRSLRLLLSAMNSDVLQISGQTDQLKESQTPRTTFKSCERYYGSFTRIIPVPPGLKESEVRSTLPSDCNILLTTVYSTRAIPDQGFNGFWSWSLGLKQSQKLLLK